MMHLGKKIKLARMSKGLTQAQLADKIHKTRPLISHIEQTGKVHHDTVNAICRVLGISFESLNQVEDPSQVYDMPTRETFEFLKRENEHLNRLVNALTDYNTHLLRRLEELERQLFKKK